MSKETDPGVNALGFASWYSIFDPTNPYIWFLQLESMLKLRVVTKQGTLFQHAIVAPPVNVSSKVTDIISKPPEKNSYNTLKKTVLNCLTTSQEKRFHQLFSQVELGDPTPSQLLQQMRLLASGYELDDEIIKELWMKCLPVNMASILTTSTLQENLDKFAEQQDAITDRLEKLELLVPDFFLRDRRRPRSPKRPHSPLKHRNQICYYQRTYGDDAKKRHPGYNYPKNSSQGKFIARQNTIKEDLGCYKMISDYRDKIYIDSSSYSARVKGFFQICSPSLAHPNDKPAHIHKDVSTYSIVFVRVDTMRSCRMTDLTKSSMVPRIPQVSTG
nr:gag pol polyprotein [Hymenolepis microstoma]